MNISTSPLWFWILDNALIFPLGLMKPMRDLSEKTASVLKNKRGGNGI